jgi:antitoxin HicB
MSKRNVGWAEAPTGPREARPDDRLRAVPTRFSPATVGSVQPTALNEMARMKQKNKHIDRSETFDQFLAKDGILAETEDAAIKEIIADQIKVAMDKQGLSKTAMAARMKTSRRQLDRLLDPDNPSVTLATLRRAASAVGRNLRVELE